ncbi:IgGFc-binding protein-like [Tachyglossus aculeatus]|uniref:IgGFc-binding protein-like n=1 Tax=Tachyglossus aculeatus TaxID=9261 RepID=UPI0018F40BD2|nr:IgGFc-binding protein-like [Tachyglossus aculeatus]
MCVTGGARDTLCALLGSHARQCQSHGLPILPWREQAGCDLPCPAHSHYELCGSSCPASCAGPVPGLGLGPSRCPTPCQEGCQCDPGFVLSGTGCVRPARCGCSSGGRYYVAGETFWAGPSCLRRCRCDPASHTVRCAAAACRTGERCGMLRGVLGCHPLGPASCRAAGRSQLSTFDGRIYAAPASCAFVLSELCGAPDPADPAPLPPFRVEVKKRPGPRGPELEEVSVLVNGTQVRFSRAEPGLAQVDGEAVALPLRFPAAGLALYRDGPFSELQSDLGLAVRSDLAYSVHLSLPPRYAGRVCGLCGDFNGDPADDPRPPPPAPRGDPADDPRPPHLTPRGEPADELQPPHLLPRGGPTDDGHPGNGSRRMGPAAAPGASKADLAHGTAAWSSDDCDGACGGGPRALCRLVLDPEGPFAACHALVAPAPYEEACVSDACLDPASAERLLCLAARDYTASCQRVNASLQPWRNASFCDPGCPAHSRYRLCRDPRALRLCAGAPLPSRDRPACSEGCACLDGFLWNGQSCVRPGQCGCEHEGRYYHVGTLVWLPGCSRRCSCEAGARFRCSAARCPAGERCAVRHGRRGCHGPMGTCSASGDPHYYSFDGAVTHFQGTCSYELTRSCGPGPSPGGLSFRVVATNRHFRSRRVSFVSRVEVWLHGPGLAAHVVLGQGRALQVGGAAAGARDPAARRGVRVREPPGAAPTCSPSPVAAHALFGTVDGRAATPPVRLGLRARVTEGRQGAVAVQVDEELEVRFNGRGAAVVRVASRYRGRLCGMCGNFNGDQADDKLLPSGAPAPSDAAFGNAWQTDPSPAGCQKDSGEGEPCPDLAQAQQLCFILVNRSGPFAECHWHESPGPYAQACIYDLCRYGTGNRMQCAALEPYAELCALHGLHLPDWREELGCGEGSSRPEAGRRRAITGEIEVYRSLPLPHGRVRGGEAPGDAGGGCGGAGVTCPPNSYYDFCGPPCPPTCGGFNGSGLGCGGPCSAGCFCRDGFALEAGACVARARCGCALPGGRYLPLGGAALLHDDCSRRCACRAPGALQCAPHACAPGERCRLRGGRRGCHPTRFGTLWLYGDPHVQTFDGAALRLHEPRRFTLSRSCRTRRRRRRLQPFAVALTVGRGPGAAAWARRLDVDVLGARLGLLAWRPGSVEVNGSRANLPVVLAGGRVLVYYSGSAAVVRTDAGLSVSFDWSHHVSVTVPETYAGALCGLGGDFNGDPRDDFRAPDGSLLADAAAFAASWREPDAPGAAPCVAPRPAPRCGREAQARYRAGGACGLIAAQDGPFRACHRPDEARLHLENCVHDLCATGGARDTLCALLGSHARQCQSHGLPILPWRGQAGCDLPCPAHSHYELCGSSCPASCAGPVPGLGLGPARCPTPCQEGCQCDPGFVLSGTGCVRPARCGCSSGGRYYVAGETFWAGPSCLRRCRCDPASRTVRCAAAACRTGERCGMLRGVLGCHPQLVASPGHSRLKRRPGSDAPCSGLLEDLASVRGSGAQVNPAPAPP